MALSTNSVIHYTNSLENLVGIIKAQGFRIKYCSENLDITFEHPLSSAFPMVSFCDIPLSEVKIHIDSYGSFGIGLNKFWAKSQALNPVLYLERESSLSAHITKQVGKIMDTLDTLSDGKQPSSADLDLTRDLPILMSYLKNYEGRLVRGTVNSDNYRFYDEREWRYIPTIEELDGAPYVVQGIQYSEDKDGYNSKLADKYLKFRHTDISYIIVDSENDIPEILTTLNEVFEDICTSKDLKILSTKIITKNQIYNDF